MYSGSHSGIAARTKRVLILGVVCWAVCAAAWLIVLSAHGHCSNARTTRVLLELGVTTAVLEESASTLPQTVFNVTSRVSTMQNTTAQRWDGGGGGVLQYYSSEMNRGDGGDGCTMVMLTYKRAALLPKVLSHYCSISSLKRILVVWNDIGTEVPHALLNGTKHCKVDIKFILSKENKLTNRYLPRHEIDTECVCLMDDDRMVDAADMNFGFEVWKANRYRVVGFEERSFIKNSKGKYVYTNYERRRFFKVMSTKTSNGKTHLPPGYSIEFKDGMRLLHIRNKTFILGKASSSVKDGEKEVTAKLRYTSSNYTQNSAIKSEGYNIMLNSCFLHRAYLEMYYDPQMVPPHLLEYVNEQKNCEDILMSVVATKFLEDIGRPQCGVLAVKAGSNLEEDSQELGAQGGLSTRPDHYIARSKCLEKFSEAYGYLPLHTSRLIMTRVSYHL